MDPQQRGRSPSAGRGNDAIRRSHSPSAQLGFNQQAHARGLDPVLLSQGGFSNENGTNIDSNPPFSEAFSEADFLNPELSQQFPQQETLSQQDFMQGQGRHPAGDYHNTFNQHQGNFSGNFQASNYDNNDSLNNVNPNFLQNTAFQNDPNFNFNQATSQSQSMPLYNASAGAQEFSGFQTHTSLAPTGLPDNMQYPHDFKHSPNPQHSGQTSSGQRSRGHSLSPATAANPNGQLSSEWAGMAFRGHRRHASDAYSDVSSNAGASPYFDAHETVDQVNGHSPMLNGQNNPGMMPEALGLGHFNLSDQQLPQHISPGHSVHASPHLSAHHPAGSIEGGDSFGLMSTNQYPGGDPSQPIYHQRMSRGPESFPTISFDNVNGMADAGAAAQMETPEISIQLAPDRYPIGDQGRHRSDTEALSPPVRSRSRQRGRAISDPYSTAVSLSDSRPSSPGRGRSPSVGLHPQHSHSRASTPGSSNGITKSRDRASSTSSVPGKREFSLDHANITSLPSSSPGDGPKRTQKHPATFQCSLCPKRFTRAYNLRSHLRTHTDERPFVCTVCGKAFARQHDRKRHEGLHSGEKKFVCKGLLANGVPGANTWGCSRRFARADALGRHFRSEAGRACIKPLLDEEARERRAAMMDQANQDMINQQHQHMAAQHQQAQIGMGAPSVDSNMDMSGMGQMTLPAALLAQYPALAGIQWDALPASQAGEDDDYGMEEASRSSFDASSGGELDFDEEGLDPGFAESVAGAGAGQRGAGEGQQQPWIDMNLGLQQQHQQQQQQQQGMAGVGGWSGQGYDGR